jgi:hypothetical protein
MAQKVASTSHVPIGGYVRLRHLMFHGWMRLNAFS